MSTRKGPPTTSDIAIKAGFDRTAYYTNMCGLKLPDGSMLSDAQAEAFCDAEEARLASEWKANKAERVTAELRVILNHICRPLAETIDSMSDDAKLRLAKARIQVIFNDECHPFFSYRAADAPTYDKLFKGDPPESYLDMEEYNGPSMQPEDITELEGVA